MSAASTYGPNDVLNAQFIAGDEAMLLASARAGNSAAFESLVMPHWNSLLRTTQRILRNREDAEDAVQTAFLDAFRNLQGFQGRSRFSSWLTRIAMNAALMRLRVTRREKTTSLDELDDAGVPQVKFHPVETRPNPEQVFLSKEGRDLLEKGIRRLKPRYSEILHLHSAHDMSAKEAAKFLELPVGTVKARLHRARAKLTRHAQSMLNHKPNPMADRRQSLPIM
ncbi:MAG TPA: sigma-70 family RNA polymerase sigma factor [Candidatus Binatia bacterium]|nr:sigma-70 family RNA polymerase sigma factor [Candidatus Binatia bacterium]